MYCNLSRNHIHEFNYKEFHYIFLASVKQGLLCDELAILGLSNSLFYQHIHSTSTLLIITEFLKAD